MAGFAEGRTFKSIEVVCEDEDAGVNKTERAAARVPDTVRAECDSVDVARDADARSLSAAQEENRKKLLDAAEKGRADEVRSLLNGVDINCRGWGDHTPLYLACSPSKACQGHTECVRLLIDAGADLNLPDKVRAARRSVGARARCARDHNSARSSNFAARDIASRPRARGGSSEPSLGRSYFSTPRTPDARATEC